MKWANHNVYVPLNQAHYFARPAKFITMTITNMYLAMIISISGRAAHLLQISSPFAKTTSYTDPTSVKFKKNLQFMGLQLLKYLRYAIRRRKSVNISNRRRNSTPGKRVYQRQGLSQKKYVTFDEILSIRKTI